MSDKVYVNDIEPEVLPAALVNKPETVWEGGLGRRFQIRTANS